MKRIILTGGGTAGHVTPNIALLPRLKELNYDIHYIVSPGCKPRALRYRTCDSKTTLSSSNNKLRLSINDTTLNTTCNC